MYTSRVSNSLLEALSQHGNNIQPVLKIGRELQKALKGWQQAQLDGNCGDIQKFSEQVVALSAKLADPAETAANSWDFDAKEYLSSSSWLSELAEEASKDGSGIRAFTGTNELVCSPVVVRADPTRQALKIGKKAWKKMRPELVVAELKKISTASAGVNNQAFLESLLVATQYLNKEKPEGIISAKVRDIYELYCKAPGWKKENPELSFAQSLHSLHKSGVQVSRSGTKLEFGWPTGQHKANDVFTVIAADGRPINYYDLYFR